MHANSERFEDLRPWWSLPIGLFAQTATRGAFTAARCCSSGQALPDARHRFCVAGDSSIYWAHACLTVPVRMITLRINGENRTVDAAPDVPLLWVLRDLLGLTGTKFGCGIAQCGACTVHLDGKPVRSCMLPIASIGEQAITTIEGVGKTPAGA